MYYSNGNYEAFARPEKPVGVERKSAYSVLLNSNLSKLGYTMKSWQEALKEYFGSIL
ncbi:MAG TPA: hypothetical protein VHP81_13510 [Lachnospiraceae bacterium]|nr:hypothetical protein [Lachnospiraceae bacterium]